jgi:hypothetical protein
MADIRINSLSTTASSTASDDFLAVDGTTNGTRKLNAYSPTFGGNLTASGGSITVSGGAYPIFYANGTTGGNFTIQKSGVSYGTFYGNDTNTVLDSAGSANLILQTGGATRATLTSTATTLTGTLTLTSTDAKLLLNASGVATQKSLIASNGGASVNYNGLYATSNWTDGNAQANSGLSSWRVDVGGFDAFTFGSDQFAVGRAPAGSTTFSKLFTVTSNGNVLVGTTTDSGNGKLQLTSHTTSAGGIGFGTDTALYRAAAGSLVVDHIGASAPTLNLSANGSIQSRLFFNGTNTFLESYTSHSLILRTNQTTALTLDSSQNATFAGPVTISKAQAAAYTSLTIQNGNASGYSQLNLISGSNTASINYAPGAFFKISIPSADSFQVSTNNTTALTLDSSQRCILAGALRLNNAYVSGAPTATGYVTLQDSAGNTYKVLVGT